MDLLRRRALMGAKAAEKVYAFSVSANKKVAIAASNLFWDGSNFQFEANPWDYPASWNANHVGLFYWSTSAAVARSAYYSGGAAVGDELFAANGGAIEGWTVLSLDEYLYLINTRVVNGGKGANHTYSLGNLNSVSGMFLYPDDYHGPVLTGNVSAMPEGVVFLPSAGYRQNGTSISQLGKGGYYYLNSVKSARNVYGYIWLNGIYYATDSPYDYFGRAIRLIKIINY